MSLNNGDAGTATSGLFKKKINARLASLFGTGFKSSKWYYLSCALFTSYTSYFLFSFREMQQDGTETDDCKDKAPEEPKRVSDPDDAS